MGFQIPQCAFCYKKCVQNKFITLLDNKLQMIEWGWKCETHGRMYPDVIVSHPTFLEDFNILPKENMIEMNRKEWYALKK